MVNVGKCGWGQADEVMVTGMEIRMIYGCYIIPPWEKMIVPLGAAFTLKPHPGRRFFKWLVVFACLDDSSGIIKLYPSSYSPFGVNRSR